MEEGSHMEEQKNTPVGDAEEQVKEIFENLTPAQMIINDIDTATTARECRKIAHAISHTTCTYLNGYSGMTAQDKIDALTDARDHALLMVTALNKGIDFALAKSKEDTK